MPQFGNAAQAGSWLQFGSYIGTNITGHRNVGNSTGRARGYYSIDGRLAKVAIPGQPILTGYGTYVRGTDVVTQALKDQLERNLINYELRFYIQDNNSKWVDFSDRCEWRGKNSLMRVGTLEYSAERLRGQLEQKISNVIVDNSDGFWDAPFPSTLKATYDGSWNLLSDSNASSSWTDSTNGYETALYHHKAAIRAHYRLVGTDTDSVMTMGIFLVEDILTSANDSSATIRISPLSSVLINSTAEDVKQGQGWYQNRRPKFLVEQLLKKPLRSYGTNSLPTDYDIDDIVDVDVPLSGTSAWVSSHFGRPPEQTTSYAGATSWNTNEVRVCRAMEIWEYGIGTGAGVGTLGSIAVDPTTATVTGTSTQWLAADHATLHCPRVGDAFIIPKEYASGDGGSAVGNDGRYTIVAINSDTSIELDRPPEGTASETSRKYSVCRIYMGVGAELYEYNLSTDTYRQLNIAGSGASDLSVNYNIRRIWYNPNDTTYPIWGAALTEEDSAINSTMKLFRFRWNGASIDFDVWGTTGTTNVYLGDKIHRDDYSTSVHSDNGGIVADSIGYIDYTNTGSGFNTIGVPITVPYNQKATNVSSVNTRMLKNDDLTTIAVHNPSDTDGDIIRDGNDSPLSQKTWDLARGYYSVTSITNGFTAVTMRYSLGQTGLLVFNKNAGTNGKILFAKCDPSTIASDLYNFTYHTIDLSNAESATPTIVQHANDATDEDYFVFSATDYRNYQPMAGCADETTDDFYIAATRFNHTSRAADTVVIKMTDQAATPSTAATRVYYDTTNSWPILEMLHTDGGLFCSALQLSLIGQAGSHSIKHLSASGSGLTSFTGKSVDLNSQLQGLIKFNINTTGSPTQKIFFCQAEKGLWGHTPNSTTAGYSFVTDAPAVPDDPYIISNVVGSSNLRALFWISGPVPVINTPNKEEGKFYFCQWRNTIPARVELADFSGLNLWEAMRMVSEIINARYGFLPDGSFFFKRWPRRQDSVYTFTNLGQNRIAGIEKSRGLEYIVNYSAKTPARIGFDDTKINIILTADSKFGEKTKSESDAGENYKHRFDALNRSIGAQTVKLVCVQGGRTASGYDPDTDAYTNPEAKFKYSVAVATTNTRLNAAYTLGDKWVDVEDADAVVYGTDIDIKGFNASTGDEQTGSSKVGYVCKINSGTALTTDGAIDNERSDIPISAGGNNITGALDNGATLTPGDIILIGDLSGETNYEYMQIVSVEAATIHVTRGIGGRIPGSTNHATGDDVVLIRRGSRLFTYVTANLSDAYSFTAGDEITLDHPDNNIWSTGYLVNSNDSSSADSASQYWIPVDGQYMPIGKDRTARETGLSLMLDYTGTKRSSEPKFSVGDQIRLETKGLMASQDQGSIKVWTDYSSIYKWQKRESQLEDNRFYDDRTALWAARREVENHKDPRYHFVISAAAMPWLSLLDIITIQDAKMLPGALQHSTVGYINSISYELNSMGAAEYAITCIEPY